jgi:hypothetical protein
VTKIQASGARLVYSTYLGGSGTDVAQGMEVDRFGDAYVSGTTGSADFPTVSAVQPAYGGGVNDAFVAKLSDRVAVGIDIKPGSWPNSVNLRSRGTVPVAILSTPTFDAATVDPTTVTVAEAAVALSPQGRVRASMEDVNGDGLLDLVVHVPSHQLRLEDDTAIVLGQTFDARSIAGADTVRRVP